MTDGLGHNPPARSSQQSSSQGSETLRTNESTGENEHETLHTELSSLISEY